MTDIVDKFSQQTLIPDEAPHRSIWSDSLPSPDFSSNDSIDDEFTPSEMSYVSTTRGTSTLPSSSSISSTSSLPNLPHPRSSTNTNTQCRLHKTPSRPYLSSTQSHTQPPPPSGLVPSSKAELEAELAIDSHAAIDFADGEISPDADEGFAEMDDPFGILAFEEEMSLRRASAPSGIRKYNVVRWRKSVECMGMRDAYAGGNGGAMLARTKVRSVPRMRRRKVDTVVE